MSPRLFFLWFFLPAQEWEIFLQINPAAVAFTIILMAAWEGLMELLTSLCWDVTLKIFLNYFNVIA